MDGEEYLYACVEAGVALAGFSALVVVLRQRGARELPAFDRTLIANLIERGLMAALFSLLPRLLIGLGLASASVWSASSAALAVYVASLAVRGFRNSRRFPEEATQVFPRRVVPILYLVGVAVIVIQVLNVLGLGIHRDLWWYLLGVSWVLVSAGYSFLIILRSWVRAA
jgi:hypothetical protein